VKGKQFYATYAGWCKDGGQKPMSRQAFSSRAVSRYTKKRTNAGQVYEGVGISILP